MKIQLPSLLGQGITYVPEQEVWVMGHRPVFRDHKHTTFTPSTFFLMDLGNDQGQYFAKVGVAAIN